MPQQLLAAAPMNRSGNLAVAPLASSAREAACGAKAALSLHLFLAPTEASATCAERARVLSESQPSATHANWCSPRHSSSTKLGADVAGNFAPRIAAPVPGYILPTISCVDE